LILSLIKAHETENKYLSKIPNLELNNIYSALKELSNNSLKNIDITNYKNITNLETINNSTNIDININNKVINNSHNSINNKIPSSIKNYNLENSIPEMKFLSFFSSNENLNQNLYSHSNKKLRFLQNFICKDNSSCSFHGECNQLKNDCICEKGYTTFINSTDPSQDIKKCNYERKQQLKAFLFELFLGFGAGHFYTERYTVAGLKLSAFIFGIFIICLFPITAKFLSEKLESDCLVLTVSCFYYLCSIGLAFWFIYDLVMFGMNRYKDGNDIDLLSWSKNPDVNL